LQGVRLMDSFDWNSATEILGDSPLFSGLQPNSVRGMIRKLKVEHWPRHKVIVRPHEPVERLYLLLNGRVKVAQHNPRSGRALTFFVHGPGAIFGLESLLDARLGSAGTETLDHVVALSGTHDLWNGWVGSCPTFRDAARRYTARHMHKLAELASDLALHDTMTRLARLFVRHCGDGGDTPARGECLIGDLPHEELAFMIGSVRVVVNRLLAALKRQGVLDRRDGKLHVLDFDKLLRIAQWNGATGIG
jgi:CRP/FNR family cyclic AMP-dependent transcriptional regulator